MTTSTGFAFRSVALAADAGGACIGGAAFGARASRGEMQLDVHRDDMRRGSERA
jgi:hypothetical protein